MNIPSQFTLYAFVVGMGLLVTVGRGAAAHDDANLLRNVASLQTATVPNEKEAPIRQLKEELTTLWDKPNALQPLAVEVVHEESKNGCKVEGVYINGYTVPVGQDRVFFYYARPEKMAGKFPAYIELTGGSGPERSLWMAGVNQCAVLDVEWRGQGNRFRSKWAGLDFNSMKGLTSLRDNQAFRLVTGIRRMIDFLEQRPEVDAAQIGCGGGSMGGYYTLLAAGVDNRVRFGVDELGAGHLADTDSALGQFELVYRTQGHLAAGVRPVFLCRPHQSKDLHEPLGQRLLLLAGRCHDLLPGPSCRKAAPHLAELQSQRRRIRKDEGTA